MPEEKYVPKKKDKSYRDVTIDIHNKFIAYCNHNSLHTGDTLSKAIEEYMKNHSPKK